MNAVRFTATLIASAEYRRSVVLERVVNTEARASIVLNERNARTCYFERSAGSRRPDPNVASSYSHYFRTGFFNS